MTGHRKVSSNSDKPSCCDQLINQSGTCRLAHLQHPAELVGQDATLFWMLLKIVPHRVNRCTRQLLKMRGVESPFAARAPAHGACFASQCIRLIPINSVDGTKPLKVNPIACRQQNRAEPLRTRFRFQSLQEDRALSFSISFSQKRIEDCPCASRIRLRSKWLDTATC